MSHADHPCLDGLDGARLPHQRAWLRPNLQRHRTVLSGRQQRDGYVYERARSYSERRRRRAGRGGIEQQTTRARALARAIVLILVNSIHVYSIILCSVISAIAKDEVTRAAATLPPGN